MGRSRTVTCPGRFALALGAVGVTHQNGHLHDVGLLQELRVHGWPRLKQHAGVPGVVGAQLLGHQCQACNVKARGSLSTCKARGSQINSANPNTAWLGLNQRAFSTPWLFTAYQVLPPHSGLAYYPGSQVALFPSPPNSTQSCENGCPRCSKVCMWENRAAGLTWSLRCCRGKMPERS